MSFSHFPKVAPNHDGNEAGSQSLANILRVLNQKPSYSNQNKKLPWTSFSLTKFFFIKSMIGAKLRYFLSMLESDPHKLWYQISNSLFFGESLWGKSEISFSSQFWLDIYILDMHMTQVLPS